MKGELLFVGFEKALYKYIYSTKVENNNMLGVAKFTVLEHKVRTHGKRNTSVVVLSTHGCTHNVYWASLNNKYYYPTKYCTTKQIQSKGGK